MTSPSEAVYEAAARARLTLWGYDKTLDGEDFEDAVRKDAAAPALRLLVDAGFAAGVAAGRTQAAADIRASIAEVEGYVWDASAPYEREIAAKIAGGEPRG